MKLVTVGLCAEYNFGSPSILHGMESLLRTLYGEDAELINYQSTIPTKESISDLGFVTKTNHADYPTLVKTWKSRNGTPEDLELIADLQSADLVADLYGICFCDNLERRKYTYPSMVARKKKHQPILFLAKKMGKRVVKNTASFGPMETQYNQKAAQFAAKRLYDTFCAREVQSKIALAHTVGKHTDILLSPDTANLMPYEPQVRQHRVGISASHQIVKQWASPEGYVACIVALGEYLHNLGVDIVFLPNEYDPSKADNDVAVCQEIQSALAARSIPSEILDVAHMTSTQLKNEIAACEAVVASRYHTCVAALSSGTPVLVLGWHYKYQELLSLYSQTCWLISQDDCGREKLVSMFQRFWALQEENRATIEAQRPVVQKKVLEAGRALYGVRG